MKFQLFHIDPMPDVNIFLKLLFFFIYLYVFLLRENNYWKWKQYKFNVPFWSFIRSGNIEETYRKRLGSSKRIEYKNCRRIRRHFRSFNAWGNIFRIVSHLKYGIMGSKKHTSRSKARLVVCFVVEKNLSISERILYSVSSFFWKYQTSLNVIFKKTVLFFLDKTHLKRSFL